MASIVALAAARMWVHGLALVGVVVLPSSSLLALGPLSAQHEGSRHERGRGGLW